MEFEIEDFVGVYKNALPEELCDDAINEFEEYKKLGLTVDRKANEKAPDFLKNDDQLFDAKIVETRGSVCAKEIVDITSKCYSHYKSIFGVLEQYESHGILHYKLQKTDVGGGYHVWHPENSRLEVCDRLFAYIAYLNDVEDGGETEFLYQHRRIKPEKGTIIIFPAGFTHTHRGNPPLSNSKYIVTGWIEFT